MGGYIKILVKEFYTALAAELTRCCREAELDDATLENILNYKETAQGEVNEY